MDFDVVDFNVRLRTIRIRELIIALAIGFFLSVVIATAFPSIGQDENLSLAPFLLVIIIFFAWSLRGTKGVGNSIHCHGFLLKSGFDCKLFESWKCAYA